MSKNTKLAPIALTVTAAAYTSAYCVGGLITIPVSPVQSTSGRILDAQVNCAGTQTCTYNLILFNALPASSTFTDRAAITINSADFGKVIGILHLTDVTTVGGLTVAQTTADCAKAFSGASPAFYAVLEVIGTPTYATVNDVQLAVGYMPD